MAEPELVQVPLPTTPAQYSRDDMPADIREGFTFLGALRGWAERQPRFAKLSMLPAGLRIVQAIDDCPPEGPLWLRKADLKAICAYIKADADGEKPVEFIAPLTQMWRNADGSTGQRTIPAPNSLQALYVGALLCANGDDA
jgi:hypothetical protein